jgi:hypothetical protein
MSLRRRVVLVGLVLFVGFIVAHSVLPWTSTVPIAAPAGASPKAVVFHCGALWASGYVHRPAHIPFPVVGTPCARRVTYRTLTFLDVLLGAAAFITALRWGRGASRQTQAAV